MKPDESDEHAPSKGDHLVHSKCLYCGSYFSADSLTCPNCGENRTRARHNSERKNIPTNSGSSSIKKYLGGFLAAVIIIGGGYYFLCNSSVESVSIAVTDWEYETSFGIYSIELTTEIEYTGSLILTLSERELTLYINEINLGTIGFSESWEKVEPGWKNQYTGTYLISDEEDIEELTSASTYEINLKFKAKAQVGIVKKYIEIREETTSVVEHY